MEGALLRGEPSAFYFDGTSAETLLHAEGIAQSTKQLFIASFNSEHCSSEVQMIGYDADSDFLIAPWLDSAVPGGPGENEIIIGSSIRGKAGDTLKFFAHEYIVVGKLTETGMGFDTSVFINLDMAQTALAEYKSLGGTGVPDGEGAVSSIAVKVASGTDIDAFAKNIRLNYRSERAAVVLPKTMIKDMSRNLGTLTTVITVLAAAIWILSVAVLTLIFILSLNERRREFGIFRAIGASKTKLSSIRIAESLIVSAIGAAIGLLLLCLTYFSFERLLSLSLDMPYLRPGSRTLTAILIGGFGVSLAAGPAASLTSALRTSNLATAALIKEGS